MATRAKNTLPAGRDPLAADPGAADLGPGVCCPGSTLLMSALNFVHWEQLCSQTDDLRRLEENSQNQGEKKEK